LLAEAGLPELAAKEQFEYSIATAPATLRQRQLAVVVIVVSLGAFGAMIPFANSPLARIDSFIPTMMAVIFVTDLVTAVLLFGQFSTTGSRALLVLASGYLFSSLIVIPHALTYPDAFTPTGLLGAGPQSTAYLNCLWRFGLAVALLGYAFLASGKHTKHASESSPQAAIIWSVTIVIVVVSTLTWATTAGDRLLPILVDGAVSPLGHTVNGMIALTNMLTLSLLWTRRRSILDLWLMVALCAMIADAVVITFFSLIAQSSG
jgi:membrane-associated sensor protein